MGEYSSTADQLAAQRTSQGLQHDSQLAQFLLGQKQARDAQQIQGQQAMNLAQQQAQLKDQLDEAKANRDVEGLKRVQELGVGGRGIKFGEVGVTEQPQPNPVQQAMLETRKQNANTGIVKSVKSDFDKVAGKSQQQITAAQSIKNALDSGNVLTLGQIKAQLPLMEGENYRPTDAERKMMLSPTGEGAIASLKNYLGGDSAAISDSQRKALYDYVQKKVAIENQHVDRSRKEVLDRWKNRVQTMDPQSFDELSNSLGSSSQELMKQIQGGSAGGAKPDMNAIMQEIQALKAKKAQAGQ